MDSYPNALVEHNLCVIDIDQISFNAKIAGTGWKM